MGMYTHCDYVDVGVYMGFMWMLMQACKYVMVIWKCIHGQIM
jgi:hypothetical protein